MTVHIANVNFEEELCQREEIPYEKAILKHPFYLQLQFLPLLYSKPGDLVMVSHLPPNSYWESLSSYPLPHLDLLSATIPPSYIELKSWGYSRALAEFAKVKGLMYLMPSWEIVQMVHSKAFAWEHAPKKGNSCLLSNEKEVEIWLKKEAFPKVLKKVLAHSGRGHLILLEEKEIASSKTKAFIEEALQEGRSLRGEKWLKKLLEFSTQWEIGDAINLLGTTVFTSSSKGSYESTISGEAEEIMRNFFPFLEEHLQTAKSFLKKVQEAGYFGPMGLDAFIYEEEGKDLLYPITEANARRTMSFAALEFQQRNFPGKKGIFSYGSGKGKTLLPSYLEINGRMQMFPKNFTFREF